MIIVAQGATPILLDAAYDHQQTYQLALGVAAAFPALGAGLLMLLPAFPKADGVAGGEAPSKIAALVPVH